MISIPLIGYVMSSFVKILPPQWTLLGPLDKFPEGTTRLATFVNAYNRAWDGEAAVIPCWVRRVSGEEFQVFAINCTHLGCPVRWFEESKLFMCPCHGGIFYEDGEHAAGPPPRALYTYSIRWRTTNFSSRPASCRPWRRPTYERDTKKIADHVRLSGRSGRLSLARRPASHFAFVGAHGGPSDTEECRQLVLRLRQRDTPVL